VQLDGSFHADATTGYNPQLDVQALLAMPALGSICPVSCQVDRCISFVFTCAEGAEEGALESPRSNLQTTWLCMMWLATFCMLVTVTWMVYDAANLHTNCTAPHPLRESHAQLMYLQLL